MLHHFGEGKPAVLDIRLAQVIWNCRSVADPLTGREPRQD